MFTLYLIFGRSEPMPTVVLLVILGVGVFLALRSGALARLTGQHLSSSDYQRRRAELVRQIEAASKPA